MDIDQRIEALTVKLKSLHSSAVELHVASQRHDAIIEKVLAGSRQDGERIRALLRIAEFGERRLSGLEGPENPLT